MGKIKTFGLTKVEVPDICSRSRVRGAVCTTMDFIMSDDYVEATTLLNDHISLDLMDIDISRIAIVDCSGKVLCYKSDDSLR